jgi:hypothetical protein
MADSFKKDLSMLTINTDIPSYGADTQTIENWQWFQTVGHLVASELAAKPRGTVAILAEEERAYWLALIEEQYYLATAPIIEGEVYLAAAALVQDLVGVCGDELAYMRSGLANWLLKQTTLQIETRQLQCWQTRTTHTDWAD